MGPFSGWLFDFSGLTPHGFCLAWEPGLIWLQAGSDALVALAYYSIPLALVHFARRRRDLVFPQVFLLFAAFILACGTTHVLGVLTLWLPLYWVDGVVKGITAALSVGTALLLWPLIPRALALPSHAQLHALNHELSEQVAERDRIAAALRASEARQKRLYASTPAPLHAVDLQGRLIEVSDHWLELLGYVRGEVIGRPLADFMVPDSAARFHEDWQALLRLGMHRDRERQLVCRDGERRDVLVSARLERDAAGQPMHVVAALTDITARLRAEAALRASEERLRQAQKMEAVGQLTGGIAHDFNNMLTAITTSLEMVQHRMAPEDKGRRLVGNAIEAAGRAARLTSQLLAFSRRQHLVPLPLDPQAVVAGLRELLARTLGERIALVLPVQRPDQWSCLADRNQLEAALLNLVLNARAAIVGEGRVTVAAANLMLAEGEVDPLLPDEEPLPPGEYVSVSVSDTGSGMTEAVRRQAFEPFFTTKPVGEGTGLGLSMVFGFARQSGGTVRIRTELGAGTAIEILLPRAAAGVRIPSGAEPAAPRDTVPRGRGETVLLVEDERTVRGMVAEALEDFGYRVLQAADADEALDQVRAGPRVDVLFTDVVMPGRRNGVELALEVRRQCPDLPVLFATGYSDREALGRWPGPVELLPKPYTVAALAGRLAVCLRAATADTAP